MTPRVSTFSLRLPISLKAAVERMAEADGTSMNQFLVMAAAERDLRGAFGLLRYHVHRLNQPGPNLAQGYTRKAKLDAPVYVL